MEPGGRAVSAARYLLEARREQTTNRDMHAGHRLTASIRMKNEGLAVKERESTMMSSFTQARPSKAANITRRYFYRPDAFSAATSFSSASILLAIAAISLLRVARAAFWIGTRSTRSQARSCGDRPALFLQKMSASCSTRRRIVSSDVGRRHIAAQWRGVLPSLSAAVTLAPAERRTSTTGVRAEAQARCKGVEPSLSSRDNIEEGVTPVCVAADRSNFTTATLPPLAAEWSAVSPFASD